MGQVVGNIEFGKHSQKIAGAHLFGDLFFKAENFKIEVVFTGISDTFVKFQDFSGREVAVLAFLKVFHGVGNTFFLVFIKRFAACQHANSGAHDVENNFFVHSKKAPVKLIKFKK